MKRYGYRNNDRLKRNLDKRREQAWKREHDAGGFRCAHCKRFVIINEMMGTVNRNHCNICLWSKHVDDAKGDRRANCNGGMRPVGLTFKHEGFDRYSGKKVGELMLIHSCSLCQKISINRIARDDFEDEILQVFKASLGFDAEMRRALESSDIQPLNEANRPEIKAQLFGI